MLNYIINKAVSKVGQHSEAYTYQCHADVKICKTLITSYLLYLFDDSKHTLKYLYRCDGPNQLTIVDSRKKRLLCLDRECTN